MNKLLNLIFPKLCIHCEAYLFTAEKFLCLKCLNNIEQLPPNTSSTWVEKILYGKTTYTHCQAFMHFHENSVAQSLLHHLKYRNKPEIGQWLADLIYQTYQNQPIFQQVDAIIYVPIHPKRKKERGYNQLEPFSKRIGKHFHIEVYDDCIERTLYTSSQTQKTKEERHYRTPIFKVTKPEKLQNKRLLLIDDMLTTGSTIMNLAQVINQHVNHQGLSFFFIATAT